MSAVSVPLGIAPKGRAAGAIDQYLSQLRNPKIDALPRRGEQPPLNERLFDASAQFKVSFNLVSMHLPREWRDKLFTRLDSILDANEWDARDVPPTVSSSLTLIRLLLLLRAQRLPSLGISGVGTLVASWIDGDDRLTVECLERDRVRFVLKCTVGGDVERHAAENSIGRLMRVLEPYHPARWFFHAE